MKLLSSMMMNTVSGFQSPWHILVLRLRKIRLRLSKQEVDSVRRKVVPAMYEPRTCRNCQKTFWATDRQKFCKECVKVLRNDSVCVGVL